MSSGSALVGTRRRLRSPVAWLNRASLAAWSAAVPVKAFVVSRVVALVSGAIGVLTMTKHDPAAASLSLHQLGPLGSVLAGSVDRFDSGYYLSIAGSGYGLMTSGKIAFSPLYPFLIRALDVIVGSGVLSGFMISAAAFLAALVLLHRLTLLELGDAHPRAADAAVLLLAFSPLSLFFSAVYTESLFLLLSVGAVLAARQDRWRLACGLSALVALTRPTGVLIVVILAIGHVRQQGGIRRSLAWALAAPATLGAYLAVLVARGYPWLAPFAAEAKWHRASTGPVAGIAAGVWAAVRGAAGIVQGGSVYHPSLLGPLSSGAESVVLLAVLVIAGVTLVWCARLLPVHYAVYSGLTLLMCVSSPVVGQPLWSLDRYTLTIFPLWMAAGAWLADRRRLAPVVAVGAALLVFYTLQFSSWAFVA